MCACTQFLDVNNNMQGAHGLAGLSVGGLGKSTGKQTWGIQENILWHRLKMLQGVHQQQAIIPPWFHFQLLQQCMCCWEENLLNTWGGYCGKGVNSFRDLWLAAEKMFYKNDCILGTKMCVGVEEQLWENVLPKIRDDLRPCYSPHFPPINNRRSSR